MNVIVIIKTLLQLVSFFVRKADEAQLKELGKDELVTAQLKDLAARTSIAKSIAADLLRVDDDTIDDLLQDYYRD